MMRKATTLVELLVIIVIVPIIMVFVSKLFNTLMTEAPRLCDNVQLNTTMINLFSKIQEDIDQATDIPQSKGDYASGDKTLLIEMPDSLICYELANEQVIRSVLSGSESEDSVPEIWNLPDVKIEWHILRKEKEAYALEIQNHIEYQRSKKLEKKMANAHLYFLGVR